MVSAPIDSSSRSRSAPSASVDEQLVRACRRCVQPSSCSRVIAVGQTRAGSRCRARRGPTPRRTRSTQCVSSTTRSTASARHSQRLVAQVAALEDLLAAPVDHLALLVHHLVVLEDVLADLGVALLDGGLRPLDGLGDHLRLDRHVVGEGLAHHPAHRAGGEQAHELVVERRGRSGSRRGRPDGRSGHAAGCRCAGSRGARCRARRGRRARGPCRPRPRTRPSKLLEQLAAYFSGDSSTVRAPRRAPRCGARPSGLPPRRMSTPRPAMLVATVTDAEAPGLGDDVRLPRVLLGVEHLVRDAPLLEQARELLGLLDRDRADEHRLARPRSARRCRRRRRRTSPSSVL